jgi:hypothetical protein
MTLLKPEKLQELAEERAQTQIEILALQEVRWPGKGKKKKKDYLFYYSGTKEKTGQAGIGFLFFFMFAPCILNIKILLLKSNRCTLCNYINKID